MTKFIRWMLTEVKPGWHPFSPLFILAVAAQPIILMYVLG